LIRGSARRPAEQKAVLESIDHESRHDALDHRLAAADHVRRTWD
jgi:hypothetical protein